MRLLGSASLDTTLEMIENELQRLGCRDTKTVDDPNHVYLATIENELRSVDRRGYDYFKEHGYAAYWQRGNEYHTDDPWYFALNNEGTPQYIRVNFTLEQTNAVLAALKALPDNAGGAQVWNVVTPIGNPVS